MMKFLNRQCMRPWRHVTRALVGFGVVAGLAGWSAAQSTQPTPDWLRFATDGFTIPTGASINTTRPRVVQLLGELIRRSDDPGRRVRYLAELGACKMPQALPAVKGWLKDPDPRMRAQAAAAAGQIGDPSIVASLKPLLADPAPSVRREAVRAGCLLNDFSFSAAGLKDADAQVVQAAISAAGPADAPTLVAGLAKWPVEMQVLAIDSLGRLKAVAHADAVAKFLTPATAVPLKVSALSDLGKMSATGQLDPVLGLLGDQHPTVRREAMLALGTVAAPQVRDDRARKMLTDNDPTVREAAARTLADPAASVELLLAQLSVDYPPLHVVVRQRLIDAGTVSIEPAAKLLDSPDARRREDGSFILGHLQSDAAFERHIALLDDSDWAVVIQTAWSLEHIGNRQAGPAVARHAHDLLVRMQKPDKEWLRDPAQATEALTRMIIASGALGRKEILPELIPLFGQVETVAPSVRGAGIWALGVSGSPDEFAGAYGSLMATYGNLKEMASVKYEAIKAMGNGRDKAHLSSLRGIERNGVDNSSRWLAHWGADRIEGHETPFTPTPIPWTATVSVTDRSDGDAAQ